ncbi:hypothetical protein BaRGS_00032459 [Batillaria attramentaria]|uniref:Endonuclease/exonuclease/phosphatase domain-containing protein n=1 Tax=Batillaria attramentaria TaxID=370345 RepID=A0ABD0JNH0_9CAEN
MPRATRRSLAKEESAPSRSSPRASTKASTAAARSPAKTRGGRSEKAEEEVKHAAEGEEPRGGRGKAKVEASPQKEEAGEPEQAEEQEEVTPKSGRGRHRGRGRGKSPAATTPSRGSRSSRRSGAAEEEAEAETPEKESKPTPTRGRGRGRPASSRSRSRPEEEKEESAPAAADVPEKVSASPQAESKKPDATPAETVAATPAPEPAAKPAAEPMEQETSAADSKPGVNNGDVSEKQESKKLTGVKRKLEEDETDTKTEVEQSGTKRARVNGEGAEDAPAIVPAKTAEVAAPAKTQQDSASATSTDSELPGDFVVVNKEDAKEREDRDEVSSTVVEVGSVAGSDLTVLSRGLDTSELQSGSNSIDGDFTGDTSITEGQLTPEEPAQPTTCQQQVFSAPNPVPVVTPPAPAAVNASANNVNTVEMAPGQRETAVVAQASVPSAPADAVMADAAAPVQNSVCPPSSKSSSSVSERLGTPDPTFLATHSSPSCFNRAYVPNPAVPALTVDPARLFSVVSYNILAECARTRNDYSYTAPEFLGQEYRHGLLMKELQYLNGDIVCLQEVNPAYFNTVLLPDMKKLGYDGLMMKRTKDYYDEGEATFYKTALFELESSKRVSLTEVARKEVEAGGLSPEVGAAVMKYLDRADVVLITKLRSRTTGKSCTVGNIHVVWDSMRSPDVQCIQAACAIKEVVGVAGGEGAPHIICGDFNSEWHSPAYQLVLDGYLSDASIRKLQAVERLELNEGSKSLVNHLWRAFQHTSSNLRSAYSTVTGSEPEITTFTVHMHNSVDYVFFSSGSLVPVGVLKTVDKAVVDATGGLPDRDFASDHLAMKAVMAFTN